MRVFFRLAIIHIFVIIYVFWRVWQILPCNKLLKVSFISLVVAELIVYSVGFFGAEYLSHNIVHQIAWYGSMWAVYISIIAFFLLVYDLFRFIDKKTNKISKIVDLNQQKHKVAYLLSAMIFAIALMSYGNYNFRHPSITEQLLVVEKKAGEMKELKIVLLSDIHAGNLINKPLVSMYVDLVMTQKPDLILLAGDIIDYDIKSIIEQNMEEEFGRLKAPYGVFASTGNHEYIQLDSEEKDEKVAWLKQKSGLTLLQDTAVLINNSFYVIGREDDKCKERKSLHEIMRNIDKNLPIFVINHEPRNLDEEMNEGADLAMYGHTHNGQLFPANLIIGCLYEVGYGYKKKNDTHIYVSSGIGLSGPQMRIGTVSEIVVFKVKFETDN